jgi:hypothetical protein
MKCSYCGKEIKKLVAIDKSDPDFVIALGMIPCHYCSQECADKMTKKYLDIKHRK